MLNKYKVSLTGYYIAEDEAHAAEQFYNEHDLNPLRTVANEVEHVCLNCSHGLGVHADDAEAPCEVTGCPCETLHFNVGACAPVCWGAE